ncbi:unnamed protein product, partial [marine sediment metagenome]
PDHRNAPQSNNMPPKRKIVQETSIDSELSPPPDELLDNVQAVAGANGRAGDERPTKKRRTKKTTTSIAAAEEPTKSEQSPAKSGKKPLIKQKVKVEVEEETVEEAAETGEAVPKKGRSSKAKVEVEAEVDENGEMIEKKVKVKRKSKADKERELVEMPLAARTVGHKLLIGAHVSAAGGRYRIALYSCPILNNLLGVHQSILNSVHIGANAFALFLKSQRKWENPPLQDDVCAIFHSHCKEHSYDQNSHI